LARKQATIHPTGPAPTTANDWGLKLEASLIINLSLFEVKVIKAKKGINNH
jgi:hypothetical protein